MCAWKAEERISNRREERESDGSGVLHGDVQTVWDAAKERWEEVDLDLTVPYKNVLLRRGKLGIGSAVLAAGCLSGTLDNYTPLQKSDTFAFDRVVDRS